MTSPSEDLRPVTNLSDRVASATISLYSSLPRHGKPILRDNGIPEYTILSALFISTQDQIFPVSLGTGVKCLPANKLPPLGDIAHDCHAEILARRGMMRWLIAEAGQVVKGETNEGVLEENEGKFVLKKGVEVWLYVSALPVGMLST